MVEGRGGLNIKDFPFAFSIAALISPNILTGTSQTPIIGILLIGGMLGSLLTIINPLSLLFKWIYKKEYSDSIGHVIFPNLFPNTNELTRKICVKNFNAALSSPAVSYETDKIIAMFYFVIILSITIVRSFMEDFTKLFESYEIAIWAMRIIATIGIVGVVMVLLHHVYGINFKFTYIEFKFLKTRKRILQTNDISQFDRICVVTVSNLAIDFANLTNDGHKWSGTKLSDFKVNGLILQGMNRVDRKVDDTLSSDWITSLSDFESHFRTEEENKIANLGYRIFDDPKTIQHFYQNYKLIKEISIRYGVTFPQASSWFCNDIFCQIPDLYEFESQLKGYIETRDWYSADLLRYRIIDSISERLLKKNMPPSIG